MSPCTQPPPERSNRRPSLPGRTRRSPGFSLVEAALATVLVATMFAAGMSAAGVAARDRLVQAEIRSGQSLARTLLTEIVEQQYADPSANTIAPWPGVSVSDRSNWKHIDDYTAFNESPPKDRWGTPVPGMTGWRWQAALVYVPVPSFAAAGASGSAINVSNIFAPVTGAAAADLGSSAASATDTGLKRITVIVTSPAGKTYSLTSLRTAYGIPDRLSTGFHAWGGLNMTVGAEAKTLSTGAAFLNTPPSP